MSHLTLDEMARLEGVADEVREVFEERGYRVDTALSQDPAFRRSERPRSALTRDLITEGVRVGASRWGIGFEAGASTELRLVSAAGGFKVLRLKRAHVTADGAYRIVTNSASSWGQLDEESMIPDEPWVFAYVLSDRGIAEIFVAPVLEIEAGNPGQVILGAATVLGHGTPTPPGGFRPDVDDNLPGFDENEGDEEQGSASGL